MTAEEAEDEGDKIGTRKYEVRREIGCDGERIVE